MSNSDRKARVKLIRSIITIPTLIALVGIALLFPQLFITRKAGEIYSAKVFPVISFLPTTFSNITFISLTEIVVVIGSLTLAIFVVYLIVCFIKIIKKNGFKIAGLVLLKFFKITLSLVLVGVIVFQAMHGMNYRRVSPIIKMGLASDKHTYEEYCEALDWAYNGMLYARKSVGTDYNHVAHLSSNFETVVYDANGLLNAISDEYELSLSPNYVRAKPVMLSRLWRYTDIVGAYDMFLGEANINTDYLDAVEFPITVCHELAHAKGYASETDCNVIADIACINSSRSDFRYSGYCDVYFDIRSKVISIARNCEYELPSSVNLPPEVYRDIVATNQYNDIFESGLIADTIARFSNDVNNAFLEANGQTGGVSTYEVPMDIYVNYYFIYVKGN